MSDKNKKNIFWFEDNKKLKLKLKSIKEQFGKQQISKELVIRGIGSKAWLDPVEKHVNLDLGYTHYVSSKIPNNINPTVKKTRMIFSSSQREELGIFNASIKRLKQPDPYKGKGIRYKDEEIKLKVGKVKT